MALPRRIPLEDFFRKPQVSSVQLSPNGTHVAWLAPWERRLNVHVRDLTTGAERRITHASTRDVMAYFWASDERIVSLQDTGGDENYRLYAISADGSNPLDLTPFPGVKCGLVNDLENEPDQILFAMNRRDPRLFDAYRMDVSTGVMRMVAENPGNVRGWLTDKSGRVRAAHGGDGVTKSLYYRDTESEPWRTVVTHDFRNTFVPLSFTFDDQRLFVQSNVDRDRSAVFEYDPLTGEHGALISEHAEVDVAGLVLSTPRRKVTAVLYETDKPCWHLLDDERRALQEFVDRALPGRSNRLCSKTRDERRWIVQSDGDRTRGSFHLVDWGAKPRLTPLFEAGPWLAEAELAEMRPISLRSRDGLTLHGYLTLPAGIEPRNLPLVVNPHGGPWHRDSWGFNEEVQFLANRGAAVLQINFRGSTGYGRTFWEASFGQWGLAMQDDVTDSVRWAVEQGFADPRRVAIYGASYGGFAALSGIVKEPDLFVCAVSYCGASNIFTWLAAFPPYWKPLLDMVHAMVGHPERDADRLRATSPMFHVDRIRTPLFVAQGANDPRVRQTESDQIVTALREHGIEVEYLVKENEGHGFQNEENQFDFYRAMERFLGRHLGLETG